MTVQVSQHYTPAEIELVEKHYSRRGRHWVAQQLGRSPDAVDALARKRGLELGDIPGFIRISELAHLLGIELGTIHQRANADGVVRRLRAATESRNTFAAVVPQAWADAYAAEMTARLHGEQLRDTEGWLTTYQLVDLWRVGKGTVLRGLNGKGALAPFLQDARTTRGLGAVRDGRWLMHPIDADRIRHRLETDRQKAKTLVSTKSISVEYGINQGYAATVGAELGGILLFVQGRLMCHVTPATANVMRQRFRESKGLTPRTYRPRKLLPPKRCTICGQAFERRTEPYESPGMFQQRKTCSPACHQKQSHATRRTNKRTETT